MQVDNVDAPTVSDHVPGAHALHSLSALADAVVEYLPAIQLVHASDPGAAHVPRGQFPTITRVSEIIVRSTWVTVTPIDADVMDAAVMASDAPTTSYDTLVTSEATRLQDRRTPKANITAVLPHIRTSDSPPFAA